MIQGSKVDGVEPTFETIVDGSYSISRPLFIYVKDQHAGIVNGLREFTQEFVSDKAAGPDGYLTAKGLVPLPEKDLTTMQKLADKLPASAKQN